MPSVYTNNLRLELIATGEAGGTWGTKTNTNIDLIAEALGYAASDMASDADATLTMSDGATADVRSLMLKVTSAVSLTATRKLTIAPNTVSKVWIIDNATTGGQSITIAQGSGAEITIANGDTRVVYTEGSGAAAAVVDALDNLTISGTLTASTFAGNVTGDLTGTATNATNTTVTDDTSTNATFYPTFVDGTSGNQAQEVSSSKLTFNPSSGTLTATAFSGDGSALSGTGGGLYKGENGEVGSSAGDIFRVHQQQLDTNVTIDSDENGLCAGPLTIASGVTLTINGNLSIV